MLLQPTLKTCIAERVVHLCGVKVDFHFSVIKDIDLTLLVDDVVNVELVGKGFNDVLARPWDPDIDIAALAATRVWVQPRQSCTLQNAPAESFALKERIQLRDLPLMSRMNLSDLAGQPIPVRKEMLRRELRSG